MGNETASSHSSLWRPAMEGRIQRWLEQTAIIAAFLFMVSVSWRRWADVMIDFGKQLYTPWRLSLGEVLYRDVYYVHGPIASYVHAGIFNLFGPGMVYLAVFNIILIGVMTYILYRYVSKLSTPLSATLASLVFILCFAFAHYLSRPNYNWIAPYVYDLTYGLYFGFFALYQFQLYMENPGRTRLALVGALIGLTFLTKMEIFIATALALSSGLMAFWWTRKTLFRNATRDAVTVVATSLLPFASFFLYFSFKMPPGEAWNDLIQTWSFIGNPLLKNLQYFEWLMGTDHLGANLARMSVLALALLAVLAVLIGINHYLSKHGSNRPPWTIFGALLSGGTVFIFRHHIPWLDLAKPSPVLLILSCLALLYDLRKQRTASPELIVKKIGLIALMAFGLTLMFKVFFQRKLFALRICTRYARHSGIDCDGFSHPPSLDRKTFWRVSSFPWNQPGFTDGFYIRAGWNDLPWLSNQSISDRRRRRPYA